MNEGKLQTELKLVQNLYEVNMSMFREYQELCFNLINNPTTEEQKTYTIERMKALENMIFHQGHIYHTMFEIGFSLMEETKGEEK